MALSELFDRVEQWWGAELDDQLIQLIAGAPNEHLAAFAESLSDLKEDVPPVQAGRLRPMVPRDIQEGATWSQALQLLLYSHEVLIDSDVILRLHQLSDEASIHEYSRRELSDRLARLRDARPLIEAGILHITSFRKRYGQEPIGDLMRSAAKNARVSRIMDGLTLRSGPGSDLWDDEDALETLFMTGLYDTVIATAVAAEGKGHVLARSSVEEAVVEAVVGSGNDDRRQLRLQALAKVNLPNFNAAPKTLIRLRQNEDQFAAWRAGLGSALDVVSELPDRGGESSEAMIVLTEELSTQFAQVMKAHRRSPFLQSLTVGASGFAVAGVTATTAGLVTGSAAAAIASGVAGKSTEAVFSYVKALRAKRRDRAILDLMVTLDT